MPLIKKYKTPQYGPIGDKAWKKVQEERKMENEYKVKSRPSQNFGIVDTKSGPFLAFMNPEQGFKALKLLLSHYDNYTVENMIKKYAPSFENNTEDYIKNLCSNLKCDKNTLVKDVNKDKLSKIISKIEGYKRP